MGDRIESADAASDEPRCDRRAVLIADPKAFDEAAAVHQARPRADVPKLTNANLIAQRDRIVGIATP